MEVVATGAEATVSGGMVGGVAALFSNATGAAGEPLHSRKVPSAAAAKSITVNAAASGPLIGPRATTLLSTRGMYCFEDSAMVF